MPAPQEIENDRQKGSTPSSPYASSGGTTQRWSDSQDPNPDEVMRQTRLMACRHSQPCYQFQSQTRRERERIIHQAQKEQYGRKQTLPCDKSTDLHANAENNVRARWIEQGIWKEEWGPAWPKGANPSDMNWRPSPRDTKRPRPTRHWAHENTIEPQLPMQSWMEAMAESTQKVSGGVKLQKPEIAVEQSASTPAIGITEAPTKTCELNISASRPYEQFLFQVSKEREWIRDELEFTDTIEGVNLDTLAHKAVKTQWIEDEIWNFCWGELPGPTWMHEDFEIEEREGRNRQIQSDEIGDGDRKMHPRSSVSHTREPTVGIDSGAAVGHSMPCILEGDSARCERPTKNGRCKRRAKDSPAPKIPPSDRVLRSARSSNVKTSNEQNSTVPTKRFRNGRANASRLVASQGLRRSERIAAQRRKAAPG